MGKRVETEVVANGLTEWEELWGRVRLTFSDEDEERYRKRCALRDKNLRKHNLTYPPVDEVALKCAMVEYSRTLKYGNSTKAYGVTAVDMKIADQYCPEVKMVQEFVRQVRNDARRERRDEVVSDVEEAMIEKATDRDGVSKADVRAGTLILGGADRETYGRDTVKQDEGKKAVCGGGIQINVIYDAAQKLMKRVDGQRAGGVIEDV